MFRITKYRNVSGKIVLTIETNDQTAADFLRFFGNANKFVELFHFRMRAAKGFDLYQKTVPARLALAEKEHAEQLARFRELPGTRIQRLRLLKEIREANGEKITLDRIDAEIRIAVGDEKERYQKKIKTLCDEGKSLNEITEIIDLPRSTVARYLRKLRPRKPPADLNPPQKASGSRSKGA